MLDCQRTIGLKYGGFGIKVEDSGGAQGTGLAGSLGFAFLRSSFLHHLPKPFNGSVLQGGWSNSAALFAP